MMKQSKQLYLQSVEACRLLLKSSSILGKIHNWKKKLQSVLLHALKLNLNNRPDTWEAWVDSIQQNPTLISENYKIVEITE